MFHNLLIMGAEYNGQGDLFSQNGASAADSAAFGLVFFAINLIVILIFVLLASFLFSFVFKKAGVAMWKAYIPIYNTMIMYELGGRSQYWILASFSGIIFIPLLFLSAALQTQGINSQALNVAMFAIGGLSVIASIWASVVLLIAYYHIGKKLQKSGWFVLLAIFLPYIWAAWLGFDKSIWDETEGSGPYKDQNDQTPPIDNPTNTGDTASTPNSPANMV